MSDFVKFGHLDNVEDIPLGAGTTPDVVGSHIRQRDLLTELTEAAGAPPASSLDIVEIYRVLARLTERVENLEAMIGE